MCMRLCVTSSVTRSCRAHCVQFIPARARVPPELVRSVRSGGFLMRRSATALACAAMVACVACGKSNDSTTGTTQQRDASATSDNRTARADNSGQQAAQQVTYEGCLQKG